MSDPSSEESQEQPANATEALRTREVFVDTEAFRRIGFDTTKPSIQALRDHVDEDRLQIHLTDITLSEIRRQIAADAQEAMEAIKRARATAAKWRRRAPKSMGKGPKLVKPINTEAVAREAFEHFRDSLAPFIRHFATRQEASEIFSAYFDREPPFDGQAGKSVKEFPDAFVIFALEDWCLRNNTFMYVVTGDGAMRRAATAKSRLLPVETLDELLQAATIEHTPDVVTTVETILEQPEFEDQFAAAIDRCIDELVVIYLGDLAEGEASDPARASDPRITDWTVISAFDKAYGLIVEFDVDLLVQVHYEDRSMASYDKEDDTYLGAEPADTEVEEDEVSLRMFIQVHEDYSVTRCEMLTSEVYIYDNSNWD